MARGFRIPSQNYDVSMSGLNQGLGGSSAVSDFMQQIAEAARRTAAANAYRAQTAGNAQSDMMEQQRFAFEQQKYQKSLQDQDTDRFFTLLGTGMFSVKDAYAAAPNTPGNLWAVGDAVAKNAKESLKQKQMEQEQGYARKGGGGYQQMVEGAAAAPGPPTQDQAQAISAATGVPVSAVAAALMAAENALALQEEKFQRSEAGKNARTAYQAAATGRLTAAQSATAAGQISSRYRVETSKWDEPLMMAKTAFDAQDMVPKDKAGGLNPDQRLADAALTRAVARMQNPSYALSDQDAGAVVGNMTGVAGMAQAWDRVFHGSGILLDSERAFFQKMLRKRYQDVQGRYKRARDSAAYQASIAGLNVDQLIPTTDYNATSTPPSEVGTYRAADLPPTSSPSGIPSVGSPTPTPTATPSPSPAMLQPSGPPPSSREIRQARRAFRALYRRDPTPADDSMIYDFVMRSRQGQ